MISSTFGVSKLFITLPKPIKINKKHKFLPKLYYKLINLIIDYWQIIS